MSHEQFIYWLKGFVELNQEPPTKEQWQLIREKVSQIGDPVKSHPVYTNPDKAGEWIKPPYIITCETGSTC